MKIKNKLLLLFVAVLFIFFLFNINNCFAVTLTQVEYNGVTYKPNVTPLTLQTKTNSYLVTINSDLDTIRVFEPYSSGDYLVLNGTKIYSYNVSSNSLGDLYCYTTTYSNSSWSSWEKTSLTSITYNSYINVNKNNIACYIEGLGIVGTDVISSGIPLPDDIKLTDNIGIFNCRDFYLVYTDNKENYFVNKFSDQSNYCCTSAGTQVYFTYYIYDSDTRTFTNKAYVKSFTTSSWGYSYLYLYNKKVYIPNGAEATQHGVGDFFQITPLMEIPEVETPEMETPILETVEQIPEVMIQTAKIVIPVGLVIFGILLIISLIKLVILRMT